ncbi:Endoglucanase E1 precursor [compost metagenome]
MNINRKFAILGLVVAVVCSMMLKVSPSAAAANKDYYYTKGSQILDHSGKPVAWNGLNWFGFETANYAPHGLWTRNMEEMLDQAKEQGYNLIRLPYSNQMFDKGSAANGIDFNKNPNLKNKTPLQIMDYFIKEAGKRGFKIILDRHRPDANSQSELWYTSSYTEKRWIDDWVMLAKRYKGNGIVIGADLHNEPHGRASWGTGDKQTDWRLAAQRAGNEILKVNGDWLIIVEGVSANVKNSSGDYWWGGNLQGVADYPVKLNVPNRLVYSAHDYGPGVHHQSWFNASNFPNNLPALWDKYWGYISKQGIAPVLVGEFGGRAVDTQSLEGKWQRKLVSYIQENNLYWTYWSLNPNSGDTGGLLLDDWNTWSKDKQEMLKPIMKSISGNK